MNAQLTFCLRYASNVSALTALILAQWWLVVGFFKLRSVTTENELGGAMLVAVIAISLSVLLAFLGWCASKFLDQVFHRYGAGDIHNWLVIAGSTPVFTISALDLTDRLHFVERQQFALAGLYAFNAGAVTYIYEKFWRPQKLKSL